MGLMGLCLLIVLGRLFFLQIWNADHYTKLAEQRQQRTLLLEEQRNSIHDQRGRMLATSIKVDSIHALPYKIKSPSNAAKRLAPILGMGYEKIFKRLNSSRSFVWLKRQVTPAVSKKVRALNIDGIAFLREYRRYYPMGNFAGPLLGFTGIDSQGLEGLEYEYQHLLQGEKYKYVVEQDGRHRIVPNTESQKIEKKDHYSLHLTLDSSIQYFAEKALSEGIARMRAKKGVAIVMETQTGSILALANKPDFDPNHFQQYSREQYLNYAVTGGFEPGSTLKLITIATALEENLLLDDQAFFCENGAYKLAGEVIHDVKPLAWLTVEQIIQKSSNICASKIGLLLTKETFFDYLQQFGFGHKVNLGLSAEAIGKLPPPEDWKTIDHASISFGHGVLASPLQLLTAANVMGTGGIMVYPYIIDHLKNEQGENVRQLTDVSGKVIQEFGPREKKRILSQKTADTIKRFMVSVTEKGGTGTSARIPGVAVAGKTGTSEIFDEVKKQYSKTDNIASFIGMVPAEAPEITVLVVVESPRKSRHGGTVAGPIFREIAERTLIFREMRKEGDNL